MVIKTDDVFLRNFGVVLASLVVFMVIASFLAHAIGTASMDARHRSEKEARARIAPVGQVRLAGDAAATPAPAAAAPAETVVAAAAADGAAVYGSVCVACHAAGVAGAPKVGDAAAWTPRAAQGMDALLNSALNGKNAMPPRGGGANLSDDEVRAAVEYMLKESGVSAN